eukprot:SAG11_NODE_137_length_15114_cov_2.297303_2_plen_197_part_00
MPMMELLAEDADEAAPNRVLQLQQPDREAVWVIEATTHASDPNNNLTLQYVVPRKKRTTQHKQTVAELIEFQSTVVLAKSSSRTAETQNIIDKFMLQFMCMQRLSSNVCALQRAGHFNYDEYRFSASLIGDPGIIKAAVEQTRIDLETWNQSIALASNPATVKNPGLLQLPFNCLVPFSGKETFSFFKLLLDAHPP